jgi:hypothetical protein
MYNDDTVAFGVDYCYKVKAIYVDGESNPTNEECETVTDPASFSTLEVPSMTIQGGNDFMIPVSLSNHFDVAGFQFTSAEIPVNKSGLSDKVN